MKFVLIGLVVIIGLFVIIITVGLTPVSRNLSIAANDTAAQVLGANYSQFDGIPQLLASWWILPVFVIVSLVAYAGYVVYKRK